MLRQCWDETIRVAQSRDLLTKSEIEQLWSTGRTMTGRHAMMSHAAAMYARASDLLPSNDAIAEEQPRSIALSAFRRPLRSRSIGQQAFTLVELLVVITIIAILASFLMPAIQKSLMMSKQVACTNNLKQMGLGMQSYVQDWRGWYPSAKDPDSPWVTWGERLCQYFDVKTSTNANPAIRATQTTTKLFLCPADDRADGADWTLKCQSSFGMNANFANSVQDGMFIPSAGWGSLTTGGWATGYFGNVTENWVKDPSGTAVVIDGANGAANTKDPITGGQVYCRKFYYNDHYEALQFHGNGTMNNYLFCDGHVSSLTTLVAAGKGTYDAPRGVWTRTKGD